MTLPTALASAAAVFALAACATPAAAPAVEATLRAGDTSPDGTAVSCRTIEVIGSRFSERACKSEAAWKQFDEMMAQSAKQETDKFQRVGSGAATNSGG